jgi:hypothetical protein
VEKSVVDIFRHTQTLQLLQLEFLTTVGTLHIIILVRLNLEADILSQADLAEEALIAQLYALFTLEANFTIHENNNNQKGLTLINHCPSVYEHRILLSSELPNWCSGYHVSLIRSRPTVQSCHWALFYKL